MASGTRDLDSGSRTIVEPLVMAVALGATQGLSRRAELSCRREALRIAAGSPRAIRKAECPIEIRALRRAE
jgi:hypothetical protein